MFPIIHLEVFVGQRHQSGICRIYRSYGWAFEGFGAAVFILTFLASLRDIEASYMVIRHIKNVIVDIIGIVSCESERYKGVLCTSLYNDEQCRVINGPSHIYRHGECSDKYYIGKQPPFTKYYFEDLLGVREETDINKRNKSLKASEKAMAMIFDTGYVVRPPALSYLIASQMLYEKNEKPIALSKALPISIFFLPVLSYLVMSFGLKIRNDATPTMDPTVSGCASLV
ncbi:unnamed protein product [Angiostrongylus costaricensis]|uniref:DUF4220 domain-containing protein n=1 Tax=Angiostrongylus costaricensis TaxID=334426 RepID=A0A0R3PA34_ANGCS|nr:unnamed protein product [Angiostrongylus costaricensis]